MNLIRLPAPLIGFTLLTLLLGCASTLNNPPPPPSATSQPTAAPATVPATVQPTVASTTEPATARATGTTSATAAAGYKPVADAECTALHDQVATALSANATTSEGPFEDVINGTSGTGCLVLVNGTGAQFDNFLNVMNRLKSALAQAGWQEDQAYLADGPTGTATAFRKGNMLALVSAGWQPSPDANCPQDQPISSCQLKPEQQLYTITVNAAEK